ncbi:MAG: restriction endonuclease subunit S [Gallionella sp.]|nr:restriction endonuclease subunit S [Gallionella sp.]
MKITKGTTPTTLGFDFTQDGVNFIKAESITRDGNIVESTFSKIGEKTHEALKRSQIADSDVLVTIAGIYLGKIGLVRKQHLPANTNQAVAIVRLDKAKASPEFIKYFLLTPSTTSYLNMLCPQSAQPNLNLTQLGNLKFNLPALSYQKKIAAILSSYDDLIENNRRRIELLEKMAEELYREWFVRMRFPGHKKVKIVKGVPEGWRMEKLDKAFQYTGGGTPSKEVNRYWEGGEVNWFTPSDITGADGIYLERSGEQCTEEGFNSSSAKMFPAYSVMLTSRATIGAIGINLTPACTNQGFITCIPNEQYPLPYLYHWIKLAKPHFELLAVGATFAELTKGTFKRIEILTPPELIVTEFVQIVSPLFQAIENHLRANKKLTETRDMLLPRLISGKLSVEHLDIQFPPSMEEFAS